MIPPAIIDDPDNGGSDPGAWKDAILHGGIPCSDFDHLIHDARSQCTDAQAVAPRGSAPFHNTVNSQEAQDNHADR